MKLLKFRRWLERHDLTKALFDEIGAMLQGRGLLMRQDRSTTRRSSLPRPRPGTRARAATRRYSIPRKSQAACRHWKSCFGRQIITHSQALSSASRMRGKSIRSGSGIPEEREDMHVPDRDE
jgi:IS5 family transposase